MDWTLIAWRALHYATTIQTAGVLLFEIAVLRSAPTRLATTKSCAIFPYGLGLAIVSGIGWFFAVAASISGGRWTDAVQDGTAVTLLTQTQFGHAWIARGIAALALAVLTWQTTLSGGLRQLLVLSATIVFVCAFAFAGHGASSAGRSGDVHLASDLLHLMGAAAWLGGLVPYVLYLRDGTNIEDVAAVTARFSDVAALSVLVIAITGLINTDFLVGDWTLMTATDYGRMLSVKICVFAVILVFASFNRFVLKQRIAQPSSISALRRNTLIEAALGAVVLILVAALGTIPPANLQLAQ